MASSKMSNGTAKPDVNISVLNKKGEILPQAAIKELKAFKSELVIKGEASEEVYRAAIHRWNEAYIEESVCHPSSRAPVFRCLRNDSQL